MTWKSWVPTTFASPLLLRAIPPPPAHTYTYVQHGFQAHGGFGSAPHLEHWGGKESTAEGRGLIRSRFLDLL